MKVISVKQTCQACPSQFELKLESGHMVYVRYRHGRLSVRKSEYPTDDIMEAVKAEPLIEGIEFPRGGAFDGVLELEELIERTNKVFDWDLITNSADDTNV